VEDEIRPQSYEAVRELHRLGIRVAMITGDSKAVADSVARRLGIDEVAAEVLPADKASAVKRFQAGDKKVAMVGSDQAISGYLSKNGSKSRLGDRL
jgi:Cu2+-exporting ATPase